MVDTLPRLAEHVVLLDVRGRPIGTAPKHSVHADRTPLHLAFSCHVVRADGSVLLTRRSAAKRTWPGVWSNACCGHPQLGETLREAVQRHLADELGVTARRIAMVIDDFTYRASMADGVVEHEVCPVVVAELDGEPTLNPDEADAARWVDWCDVRRRASDDPRSLSPWSVAQIERLPATAAELLAKLDAAAPAGAGGGALDEPIRLGAPRSCAGLDGRTASTVAAPVEAILASFVADRRRELALIDPGASELGDAIAGLVAAGGKRMRPAFVYWGWRAAAPADPTGDGDDRDHAAWTVGAAMELLHTFALLHDDVMDGSLLRRGHPTAHVALAGAHREDGRRGDADAFGASAATLAGDLAFVWADQMLDSAGAIPSQVRDVFTQLRTEVIVGQHLDLRATGDPVDGGAVDDRAAAKVALLKSARYTVTRPLQLGAALAGGGPSPALGAYGDAIGLAFQMRDDVLDLFGDPARTGKGSLDDLREGKQTLLLARALRLCDDEDRAHLRVTVGDRAASTEALARCRDIVAGSGALASVEALIDACHRDALGALDGVARPARDALRDLALLAVARDV